MSFVKIKIEKACFTRYEPLFPPVKAANFIIDSLSSKTSYYHLRGSIYPSKKRIKEMTIPLVPFDSPRIQEENPLSYPEAVSVSGLRAGKL